MRRKFNVKFFAILVGAIACFLVGVHFLHGYQVRRNASALLEKAQQAEDRQDFLEASELLNNYLGYVPNNTDMLARYGQLLDQLSTPSAGRSIDFPVRVRAFLVLEKVLRLEPKREDIRRKLAKIAVDLGRFSDAEDHIKWLLESSPNDGELMRLKGQCQEVLGAFDEAAKQYKDAIKHSPQDLESYELLAGLWRRHAESRKTTDQFMKDLGKLFEKDQSFSACLGRALLSKELSKETANDKDRARFSKESENDIDRARQLAPDEANVILAVSELARERGKFDQARKSLRQGLNTHHDNAALYLALAQVELADNRLKEAEECLELGLKNLPNEQILLWSLASLLVEQGKDPEPQIASMRKLGVPAAEIDLLNARLALHQEKWLEAIQTLERVRLLFTKKPELSKRIDLYLGQAYRELGDLDQSYAAYRRALAADPSLVPASLGMASALVRMGKIDDAIETYEKIVSQAPGSRLEAARLRVIKNMRLPENQRRWEEIDRVLANAAKAAPDQPEIPILLAESLLAQRKSNQAEKLITEARDKHPKEVILWVALAELSNRQGKPEVALAILDQAQEQLGDSVDLRLARARCVTNREGAPARDTLAGLEGKVDPFSENQRLTLWRGLAGAYVRLGDLKKAAELWRRIAEKRPHDLAARLALFDMALEAGDQEAMESLVQAIKNIEGEDGTLWRYGKSCELIWKARKTKDPELLNDARAQIIRVAARRPTWSRVALCEARIDDLHETLATPPDSNPNFSAAIKNYLQAIDLGERDPEVIRRVVDLLREQSRYPEVDDVLKKLPEQILLSGDMQRLQSDLSYRTNKLVQALDLAKKVANQSKDYRDHLWLGHMLWANGMQKEAAASYGQAVKLKETAPEAYVAWIRSLAATDQKPQAEAALQQAEAKLPADSPAARLALAQCYEVLKHEKEAQERLEAALQSNPNDMAALRSSTAYWLQKNDPKKAEVHLRKIIKLKEGIADDGDADWARIMLAIVLAGTGLHEKIVEAEFVLGIPDSKQSAKTPSRPKPDKLRAQALVLAMQRLKSKHRRAIEILEKNVAALGPLTADDRFLLAKLYDSVGDWPKARTYLNGLVGDSKPQPSFAAAFARGLVIHQDTDLAQTWVDRLEAMPDVVNTFDFLEIKTRLLAAQKKTPQAIALVKGFPDLKDAKPADRVVRVQLAATLLDGLSQLDPNEKIWVQEAEKLYREYVQVKPEGILALIGFLSRHGRLAEALDSCEKAWQSCSPDAVAIAALTTLQTTPGNEGQLDRVERWLQSAKNKDPKTERMFMVRMAALRDLQGRYAESISLYRKVLAQDPDNPVALNNLSWLLALRDGKSDEALELVEKAIKKLGPSPSLLDTRAIVYLTMNRSNQAIQDLEEAVATAPTPANCFHLAEAYQMGKQTPDPKAKRAFEDGLRLGLKAERLHGLEREGFNQLRQQLGPNDNGNRLGGLPISNQSSHVSKP